MLSGGVVDLVRHAAHELPQRRELLGLLQLGFGTAQVGHVPRERQDAGAPLGRIADAPPRDGARDEGDEDACERRDGDYEQQVSKRAAGYQSGLRA